MNDQQRDAIIVTMPVKFFQEYTLDKFEQDIQRMNEEDDFVWYRVMKNLPKVKLKYCYFLYDGKIQYRVEIAEFVRNQTMRFARPNGGVRTFPNANYLELVGPAIKAPHDIPMKGFQGFRYTELIF